MEKQYLSIRGRVTLIKGVADRLDHIRANFLWDRHGDKKRPHPMKWNELIKLKQEGGCGSWFSYSKQLVASSQTVVVFGEEKETFWRKTIISKYGEDKWG